jgi:hypothetical protein
MKPIQSIGNIKKIVTNLLKILFEKANICRFNGIFNGLRAVDRL